MKTLAVGLLTALFLGCSPTPPPTVLPSATPTGTPAPSPTSSPSIDPLLVTTDKGQVRGVKRSGARQFLGIPYAAPPVGGLRWRPPVPPPAWSGIRTATLAGSVCPQTIPIVDMDAGTENCLFINVETPDPPPQTPAPVMVWIHGGGFTSGDGLQYNGTNGSVIAKQTGVVVVSFNYRLGPLGFLAHPLLTAEDPTHPSSGNYGIEDQIAALKWVRDNIAAFGGDPGNVTIFGESAGGMSVCLHLASQLSAGLFHRAIIESGPCTPPFSSLAAAEAQGDLFASKLGCDSSADVLACLRSKSQQDVMNALPPDPNFVFTPGTWGSWAPTLDQYVLDRQVGDRLADGTFNHTPVLVGANKDEGTLFVAMAQGFSSTPLTADQYPERLKSLLGSDALVTQVMTQYPLAAYPDPGAALAAAFGDAFLACPTIRAGQLAAPYVPTYIYQFEYPDARFAVQPPFDLGAFHSAEVQFVFQQPPAPGVTLTNEQIQLSNQIMGYWTRFAATGDPNGAAAPAWPRVSASQEYLGLDRTIATGQGPKAAACAFWNGIDYLRPPLTVGGGP
jgi:para-nitrobenzyl esterase